MGDQGPPSEEVLRAFGATETPVRMPGAQGQAYRAGRLVFKPAQDTEETHWVATFYLSVACDGFRVPKPVRASNGRFVWGGWQAMEYLEGEHREGHWQEKIDLCLRFHRAIVDFPRPAFFARRAPNPWVVADRVVWGEMRIDHHPRVAPVIERLARCLAPVDGRPQLIHGDFGGNVLFADGLPPAIIDFSPYWRPVEFAVGVVVADAIVWEGADLTLLDMVAEQIDNLCPYLARAELRRIVELEMHHRMAGLDTLDEIDAHLPLVQAICERCR